MDAPPPRREPLPAAAVTGAPPPPRGGAPRISALTAQIVATRPPAEDTYKPSTRVGSKS